jgi:hypothetical protein
VTTAATSGNQNGNSSVSANNNINHKSSSKITRSTAGANTAEIGNIRDGKEEVEGLKAQLMVLPLVIITHSVFFVTSLKLFLLVGTYDK